MNESHTALPNGGNDIYSDRTMREPRFTATRLSGSTKVRVGAVQTVMLCYATVCRRPLVISARFDSFRRLTRQLIGASSSSSFTSFIVFENDLDLLNRTQITTHYSRQVGHYSTAILRAKTTSTQLWIFKGLILAA